MAGKARTPASRMALGGMLAALAVVEMCLGTLIPVATYLCPMAAMLLAQLVYLACGSRVAWAWYVAVALLSLLLAPDKEAAAVFLFLGYYPMVKPRLEKSKLPWLWKAVLFNCSVVVMSWLLARFLGISMVEEELERFREILLAVMLGLGNLCFFLADRLLTLLPGKLRGKR